MITAVPTKLTERQLAEIEEIVKGGWYASKSEFIRDAVRILIKRVKAERLESAIKGDILWGLYGA